MPHWTAGSVCWGCMLRTDRTFDEQSAAAHNTADAALGGTQFPITFGDYLLETEIAHGGMGVVYRARQKSLHRVVAIKLLLLGRYSSAESVDRFRREAQSAAALRHPNIVAVYEVGQCDGQHFISMEYIDGQTLASMLRNEPLPPARAAEIVRAIADAIQFAHEQGVLHRDLKPSNVLIDALGTPRLTDFGLAKKLDGSSDLTVTGQMIGTPNYLSPEQAAGNHAQVGPHSDVYSIGALLYETLTGRPPFLAASLQETLLQIRNSEPVSPRTLNPAVDRDLATICLKCLQKETKRRYSSAAELSADLQRWQRREPIHARPVPFATRSLMWCRRNPRWAAMLSALLMVVLAGFIGVTAQWQRAERHRVRLEAEQKVSRQNLYSADMFAASKALGEGDLGLARRLLESHLPKAGTPDLRGFEWHFLASRSGDSARFVLRGHSNLVQCLAFSPDGRFIASGSWDGTVKLWNAQAGLFITNLLERTSRVFSVSFSADSRQLAVGGWGQLSSVDLPSRTVTDRPAVWWSRALFSPVNSELVISERLNFWNVLGGQTKLYPTGGTDFVRLPTSGGRFAYSGNGKVLASALDAGRVRFWDSATGQSLGEVSGFSRVADLALGEKGDWLAVAANDENLVRLFSVPEGDSMGELSAHRLVIRALAASPKGDLLASAGEDHRIVLWDVQQRQVINTFDGHESEVHALAFSADGEWLASGGKDDTIHVWKVHAEHSADEIAGVGGRYGLRYPLLSADGRLLAVNSAPGDLKIFNAETRRELSSLPRTRYPLAFSPDNRFLATIKTEGSLELWDVETGAARGAVALARRPHIEMKAALSPDGSLVAVSEDHRMYLCDTRDGHQVAELGMHRGMALGVTFSPDGKWLAICDQIGNVQVWNVASRARQLSAFHKADTRAISFSPDSRILATGGHDNEVKVWDVENRQEIVTLRGHKAVLEALAFTEDGRSLLSLSGDSLRFWTVANWRPAGVINTPQRNRLMTFAGNVAVACGINDSGPVRFFRAVGNGSSTSSRPATPWSLTNLPPAQRLPK